MHVDAVIGGQFYWSKLCQTMHLAVSLKCLSCGRLHVSISLTAPSVLNIRLTAKQHNVVELTGS